MAASYGKTVAMEREGGLLSGVVRSPVPDPSHLRKKEARAPPELVLYAARVLPGVRQGRGGEGVESEEIWDDAIRSTTGGHRQPRLGRRRRAEGGAIGAMEIGKREQVFS
jgi:hypothetical protein